MAVQRTIRLDRLGLFVRHNGENYRPVPPGSAKAYTLSPALPRGAGSAQLGQRVAVSMVPATPVLRLELAESPVYWEVRDCSAAIAADPEVYAGAARFLENRKSVKDEFFSGLDHGRWTSRGWDVRYAARHATGACIMGALMVGAYEAGYPLQEIDGFRLVGPASSVMQTPRSANAWNNQPGVDRAQVMEALAAGQRKAQREIENA